MNCQEQVALVTGGSQRIGRALVKGFHARGLNVVVHYRSSEVQALSLVEELNDNRPDSAIAIQADLRDISQVAHLGRNAATAFGRLDILINNASTFRSNSLASASQDQLDEQTDIHIKAPYFLVQSVVSELSETHGCVVNVTDIYATRPLGNYSFYCASKAALESLTRSLALELAPKVRVNAIAPGAILWPENKPANDELIKRTPLKRIGRVEDVVAAVNYLVFDATFTTGQILSVDGGRSATTP